MTYQICIPNYSATPELTEKAVRCLASVRDCSEDYQVLLVDNGSPEEHFRHVAAILETMPHMLIRNSTNQGFVKATNQGLQFSTAPYCVLLNNDTEVVPGWLDKLREPFEENTAVRDMIGLSGPLTNTRESWQGRWKEKNPDAKGWIMLATGRMLAFFAVMISRRCLDAVGYLDEDFGAGLGDDDTYCDLAEKKGFRLALVQDLVIEHHHRSTFRQLYSADTVKAMQVAALTKFREKQKSTKPLDCVAPTDGKGKISLP